MRMMQRVVLLIVLLVGVVFCVAVTIVPQKNKLSEQWELLQTERFLQKLCRIGQCSEEDILLYANALNLFENGFEIRLEEFQKESAGNGQLYYYLISWEEIQKQLSLEENYLFQEGSVLVITVKRLGKSGSMENKYYDTVMEKD